MASSTRKPYELTVSEMARAVAKRELTPTEIVESSLERIAALEPRVHAWSYMDIAGIRAHAAVLTAEAAAGKLRGPLHGVPVGIKDQFDVKGMPSRMRLSLTSWYTQSMRTRRSSDCTLRSGLNAFGMTERGAPACRCCRNTT